MSAPAGSLLDNRAAAALMAKFRGAAEHSDPLSGLSDQERVLLDLLGEGLTNKENAARISSPRKPSRTTCRACWPSSVWNAASRRRCSYPVDQSHRRPEE